MFLTTFAFSSREKQDFKDVFQLFGNESNWRLDYVSHLFTTITLSLPRYCTNILGGVPVLSILSRCRSLLGLLMAFPLLSLSRILETFFISPRFSVVVDQSSFLYLHGFIEHIPTRSASKKSKNCAFS